MKEKKLLSIINILLKKKGIPMLENLNKDLLLMDDLSLDSLDLAEMTVLIEDEFGIDVFEDGLVRSVNEVLDKL